MRAIRRSRLTTVNGVAYGGLELLAWRLGCFASAIIRRRSGRQPTMADRLANIVKRTAGGHRGVFENKFMFGEFLNVQAPRCNGKQGNEFVGRRGVQRIHRRQHRHSAGGRARRGAHSTVRLPRPHVDLERFGPLVHKVPLHLLAGWLLEAGALIGVCEGLVGLLRGDQRRRANMVAFSGQAANPRTWVAQRVGEDCGIEHFEEARILGMRRAELIAGRRAVRGEPIVCVDRWAGGDAGVARGGARGVALGIVVNIARLSSMYDKFVVL